MGRSAINSDAWRFAARLNAKRRGSALPGGWTGIGMMLGVLLALAAVGPLRAQDTPVGVHGLPFARFYSFDEIGNVGPGARLGFDSFGRLAVSNTGGYAVLNDTTWIDITNKQGGGPPVGRL